MSYVKKYLLLFIIFIISCTPIIKTESQGNIDQLLQKVTTANSNIESYSFEQLQIGSGDSVDGQASSTHETKGYGEVDRKNKLTSEKYILNQTIVTSKKIYNNYDTIDYYISNWYIYSKTNEYPWVKFSLKFEIDFLQSQVRLLQNGTVEGLGEDSLEGRSYYIIKVNHDKFKPTIEEYSSIFWIDKESLLIKMIKTRTIDPTNEDNQETSIFSNFNQEFNIIIPEDAKNAEDITELRNKILNQSLLDEILHKNGSVNYLFE